MDEKRTTEFPARVGRPALSALATAGYAHLEELTSVSEAELLKLHGMGPKGIRILRESLNDQPLKLMCVLAHPDDESLATGGVLAKYAELGVQTDDLFAGLRRNAPAFALPYSFGPANSHASAAASL